MSFQLHLLGTFKLIVSEQAVTSVRSRRVLALLAYLVCETRPVPRTELAHLLWPDKTEKQGRTNLRWAIGELRKLMPDAIVSTRQTVEFVCPAGSQVDLYLVREQTFQVSETWKVFVLNLHSTLLDGFYFDESVEYETWLITQREIGRQQVHRALDNAIEQTSDTETALKLAQHLLSLDTWEESYHRRVINLLARLGNYEAAIAQFEVCQRILQEELGATPTQETITLIERIRQLSQTEQNNLPPQPTPFIGRDDTIRQIYHLLAGDVRLVTIVGAGGMGKTRLALATAAECTSLVLDGVAFVSFVGVSQPSFMATAMIQGLSEAGIIPPLEGNQPPAGYLIEQLRDKEVLLVLDNLEHLLDGSILLSTLLKEAPKLTILATSRERLNLRWEHLVEIEGLPYPTEADDPAWHEYAAIKLFIQSAQRAKPDFVVSDLSRPGITRICQLTEGMPLGIELSANAIRSQTPTAIADAISQNLNPLASRQRDGARRHRSIRATLDHSWSLLDLTEQVTLAQLAVFRGDFPADAALAITIADRNVLASLVKKSLLRQRLVLLPAGGNEIRYDLHEFIRQYAYDNLGLEAHATQTDHAHHYATFLRDLRPSLHTHEQQASRHTIERNLDNIRHAWSWLVNYRSVESLSHMLYSLTFFYLEKGWYQQGWDDLNDAYEALPSSDPTLTLIRTRLVLHMARCNFYLGQHELATQQLQDCLPIFTAHNTHWEMAMCNLGLGIVTAGEKGTIYTRQAIKYFTLASDHWYRARTQLNLANRLRSDLGSWHDSVALIESSIELLRQLGDELDLARALLFLARHKRVVGEFSAARELLEESLVRHKQIDSNWGIGLTLLDLAWLAIYQGDFALASQWLVEGADIYDRLGQISGQLHMKHVAVELAYDEGDFAKAIEASRPVLELNPTVATAEVDPIGGVHHILGLTAFDNGDYPTAHEHFATAEQILTTAPDYLARLCLTITRLHLAENNLEQAENYLKQGMEIAKQIDLMPVTLYMWLTRAAFLHKTGQNNEAIELMEEVIGHPAGTYRTKKLAQKHLHQWHLDLAK